MRVVQLDRLWPRWCQKTPMAKVTSVAIVNISEFEKAVSCHDFDRDDLLKKLGAWELLQELQKSGV